VGRRLAEASGVWRLEESASWRLRIRQARREKEEGVEAVRTAADMTRSPMFFLLLLIATALFSAFIVDAGIHLWTMFSNAIAEAVDRINAVGVTVTYSGYETGIPRWDEIAGRIERVGIIEVTYTEPSINPRWAADQIAAPLTAVLWILVAALIILIIYAYREHDED
jgi:hypothetical protein